MQWKQIDEVRRGMRNVITFQKFIHPLQTQQIVSDNLLHLAEATKDNTYVDFQRTNFQKQLDRVNDLIERGKHKRDVDSENLLQGLIRDEISDADWKVVAKPDLPEEGNYALAIIQKYLDRKQREFTDEKTADEETTNFLRRTVEVNEIELMILKEQKRAQSLIDDHVKKMREYKERKRREKVDKDIKEMCQKKLAVKASDALKRGSSFKGRVQNKLAKPGYELQGLIHLIEKGRPQRPESSEGLAPRRVAVIRPIKFEHQVNFDEGFVKDVHLEEAMSTPQRSSAYKTT